MVRKWHVVTMDGARVRLLLAPSLYGVARQKGIDLTIEVGEDAVAVTRSYAKVAYAAALNAWEVDAVDNPDAGEFPYNFADFDEWAANDPAQLVAFIDAYLLAFTGKGLKELTAGLAEGEPKKAKGE